ncbi:MAG: VOC family protein [Anaerolineae bacterium]|nr:VOC family protein [Anaerolineae bacterium]
MTVEVDHLFICTRVNAPEIEPLLAMGLNEGQPNWHPGQGTANRRIFFHNAFLEFLWVHNEAEATSEVIQPMGLWERWQYRQSGASPFGLALRSTGSTRLPFETWAYRPPYLPPSWQIDVATNSVHLNEPLLFHIPFGGRPDTFAHDRQQPLTHPAGLKAITQMRLTLPQSRSLSPALAAIQAAGLVQFSLGQAPLAEVTFDQAQQGCRADFRPELPLVCRW